MHHASLCSPSCTVVCIDWPPGGIVLSTVAAASVGTRFSPAITLASAYRRGLHLVPHGSYCHRPAHRRLWAYKAGVDGGLSCLLGAKHALSVAFMGEVHCLLVLCLFGTGEESRRRSPARCRLGAKTPAGLHLSLRFFRSFGLLACLVLRMQFSGEEYSAAGDDPVAAFAAPIAAHMNADHAEVLALTFYWFVPRPLLCSSVEVEL